MFLTLHILVIPGCAPTQLHPRRGGPGGRPAATNSAVRCGTRAPLRGAPTSRRSLQGRRCGRPGSENLGRFHPRRSAEGRSHPKISKTTPCKVAWWSPAWAIPQRHFDTSGKSPANFHHRVIRKTPVPPARHRAFRRDGRQQSLCTVEVAPARHSQRDSILSGCALACWRGEVIAIGIEIESDKKKGRGKGNERSGRGEIETEVGEQVG